MKYGVINEDYLSLRSPRSIDENEHDNIVQAFRHARDMIINGEANKVSVVACRYSKQLEAWVEVVGGGSISIENNGLIKEEDED